jgi:hypothetical protein
MGKAILPDQVVVDGSFEAPTPEAWPELDPESSGCATGRPRPEGERS